MSECVKVTINSQLIGWSPIFRLENVFRPFKIEIWHLQLKLSLFFQTLKFLSLSFLEQKFYWKFKELLFAGLELNFDDCQKNSIIRATKTRTLKIIGDETDQGSLTEEESTVDLLVPTSLDQLLFLWKYYLPFLQNKLP